MAGLVFGYMGLIGFFGRFFGGGFLAWLVGWGFRRGIQSELVCFLTPFTEPTRGARNIQNRGAHD